MVFAGVKKIAGVIQCIRSTWKASQFTKIVLVKDSFLLLPTHCFVTRKFIYASKTTADKYSFIAEYCALGAK